MLIILTNRNWRGALGFFCLAALMQISCREEESPKVSAPAAPTPPNPSVSKAEGLQAGDSPAEQTVTQHSDPKLEGLMVKLAAKWDGVSSAKANITMTAVDKNASQNLQYGGYGQYACKNINGRLFIRRDMVNGTVPAGGLPLMERNSTIINGPEFTYFFGEEGGKLFAQKRHAEMDEIVRLGGRTLFNQLNRLYSLATMPDAEIDGQAVHVIGGTTPGSTGRVSFSFSAESGAMVQMRMETISGENTRIVQYSNIELNPDIDDSQFDFKPPPGLDVLDLTRPSGLPKKSDN